MLLAVYSSCQNTQPLGVQVFEQVKKDSGSEMSKELLIPLQGVVLIDLADKLVTHEVQLEVL